MKHKIVVDVEEYDELIKMDQLDILYKSILGAYYVTAYKHRITGIKLILKEDTQFLEDYKITAHTDSTKAMNNFKDHLKIIGIK
tara:strand:+ start:6476 stop:6727 length:252 start_codon:yes stop_codon:yes gene_type:complete